MPVYFNIKKLFTIPRDDESDISENELYLEDPEMLFDRLPQPFRFINKIINKICNDSWSRIVELNNFKQQEFSKRFIESIQATDRLEQPQSVQCMCVVEHNQVLMGMKNGISLWTMSNEEKPIVQDYWTDEGMNVLSMVPYKFGDDICIVAITNDDGSARLLSILLGRIYFLRDFPVIKEGDKPAQITNIVLDPMCGTISVSYSQMSGEEHWLEVYKVSKDAWTKEIGTVLRGYRDYLHSQVPGSNDEVPSGDTNSNDTSGLLDRNAIKVTPTNVYIKMKFPDTTCVPGIGNIQQLYKQVDQSGSCMGLGLNHCITKGVIEARTKASLPVSYVPSTTESHLMRIPNVRFLRRFSNLLQDASGDDSSEQEFSIIVLWWSQSQHLLFYGLNKPAQKDPWVKPDDIRTFSCPISICEVSLDNDLLVVGLQNGIIILIDTNSGQTRFLKQISNYPIKSIYFLQYQYSENVYYINVADDNHAMFCVTYNLSLGNSGAEALSLESDRDVDSVAPLGQSFDMVISMSRKGPMILRDLFSGTAILKMELPDNTELASPWQPIFALVCDGFLFVQVSSKSSEEEDVYEDVTLLYKLNLEQFKCEDKVIPSKPDSRSYITRVADEYLTKRHGAHNFRQNRLEECFANLSQYLSISSVA